MEAAGMQYHPFMAFVCFRCRHRTSCGKCGNEIVHDLGDRATQYRLVEVERSFHKRRQARILGIGVLATVVVFIPLYFMLMAWVAPYLEKQGIDGEAAADAFTILAALAAGVATALSRKDPREPGEPPIRWLP
jgi:hypothetical protein